MTMPDDNQTTNDPPGQEAINQALRAQGFVLVEGANPGMNQYEDLLMYNLVLEVHPSTPPSTADIAKGMMEREHRRGTLHDILAHPVVLGHN